VSTSVLNKADSFSPSLKEVQNLITEYLQGLEDFRSNETLGTYKRSLNQFVKWLGITKMKSPFTERGVENYKKYLIERKGLKEASISTYLTAVRRFFEYLVDRDLMSVNPAMNVQGSRRPTDHSRDSLSKEQVQKLIKSINLGDILGLRDRAIIECMVFGGLSEIELVRANVNDLEQTLMGNFLRVQGKGRTAKDQQVQIDGRVFDSIKNYLTQRENLQPDDPLFASHGFRSNGKSLTTRAVRNRISLQFDLAELSSLGFEGQKITPHSLTHTAAVLWLGDGMSIEEVKKRMRHGSLETTQIYVKEN